jgi:transglutaminase-like putative cysteine protease
MSGYLATPQHGDELSGANASHAWIAVFIPGSGWVDLDPTNNLRPRLQHVVLGWGRDFSDITPMRGVINAGGEQLLKVSVIVTPDARQ